MKRNEETVFTSIYPACQPSSLQDEKLLELITFLEDIIETEANLARNTVGNTHRCFEGVSVFAPLP